MAKKSKSEPAPETVSQDEAGPVATLTRKWIVQVQTLRPEVIEADSEEAAREEYRQRLNFITTRQPWMVREITGEDQPADAIDSGAKQDAAPVDDESAQPLVI